MWIAYDTLLINMKMRIERIPNTRIIRLSDIFLHAIVFYDGEKCENKIRVRRRIAQLQLSEI